MMWWWFHRYCMVMMMMMIPTTTLNLKLTSRPDITMLVTSRFLFDEGSYIIGCEKQARFCLSRHHPSFNHNPNTDLEIREMLEEPNTCLDGNDEKDWYWTDSRKWLFFLFNILAARLKREREHVFWDLYINVEPVELWPWRMRCWLVKEWIRNAFVRWNQETWEMIR